MFKYNSQLQKVINLTKITGDKIIIIDKNDPEDMFVIINFNEYEKIIYSKIVENNSKNELKDLTEQKSLDKINQNIAFWKNENDLEVLDNKWEDDKDCGWKNDDNEEENDKIIYSEYNEINDNKIDIDDSEYYNVSDKNDNFNKNEKLKIKKFNHWQIPPQVKQKAKNITEEETRNIITSL